MRHIIIDRSKFAEADDGDTCHYGGEITLTVKDTTSLIFKIGYWLRHRRWVKDTKFEMTYCCRGSDRSGLEAKRCEVIDGEKIYYHFDEEFRQHLGDPEQIYEDIHISCR